MELQTQQKTSGELAATASAALAKATIEAKFSIALHRPRSVLTARQKILEACKRKGFAETARYAIPRKNNRTGEKSNVEGFSIRFAEAIVQAWGNVDVTATIAYEDEAKRLVRISVVDLETNTSYTDEVVLDKTIERQKVYDDQDVISERTNSEGKTVYVIRAPEGELLMKVNAAKSRSIRTSGLRLVPQDILDEAWDACQATMAKDVKEVDPQSATKKICDSFASLGVSPADIEKKLGHALTSMSPSELRELRAIWTSIKDGESSWADHMKKADEDTIDMSPPRPESKTEIVEVVVEKKKEAPQTKSDETPWNQMLTMIKDAGASFDDFVYLAKEEKQVAADVEFDGIDAVPVGVLNSWIARPKAFAAAIKIAKGIKR